MTPGEQELVSRYQFWKEVMDVSEGGNNDYPGCSACNSCGIGGCGGDGRGYQEIS